MTAQEYPVTFGYGRTDSPYSVNSPHKGQDRSMPAGTPIILGDTTIGLSGNSGSYKGVGYKPHLHIQAWTNTPSNARDPKPYAFKPGRVVNVSTGPEWGKFVTIDVNGVMVSYCHLSEHRTSIGKLIKEGTMPTIITQGLLEATYRVVYNRNLDDSAKSWIGQPLENLITAMDAGGSEVKNLQAQRQQLLNDMQTKLNEQSQRINELALADQLTKKEVQNKIAKIGELTSQIEGLNHELDDTKKAITLVSEPNGTATAENTNWLVRFLAAFFKRK